VAARAKLTAIVLRSVDTGDADRVVTLLTRERGKVAAFARGARTSRRRFGGSLEPFTLVTAEVRERAGSDLLGLESVSPRSAFGGIRGDLARIACAGYAAELAREIVRDNEPHEYLFDLLAAYLAALDAAPARPAALRAFELGALRAAGLAPRLDACARCGGPRSGWVAAPFDPGQGGVLCPACAPWASAGAPRLTAPALDALAALASGGLAAALEPLPPQVAREAREALTAFLEHHLGRRLKARRFLDEIGPMLAEAPSPRPSPPVPGEREERVEAIPTTTATDTTTATETTTTTATATEFPSPPACAGGEGEGEGADHDDDTTSTYPDERS
jgi:DNA repair protein RecO (recombination protein O)